MNDSKIINATASTPTPLPPRPDLWIVTYPFWASTLNVWLWTSHVFETLPNATEEASKKMGAVIVHVKGEANA